MMIASPTEGDYPNDAQLYGTRVLGTPIGHDAYVESFLNDFIANLAAQGDILAKYAEDEPKVAFLLLNHCFSKKVNHLLRALSSDSLSSAHYCPLQ